MADETYFFICEANLTQRAKGRQYVTAVAISD